MSTPKRQPAPGPRQCGTETASNILPAPPGDKAGNPQRLDPGEEPLSIAGWQSARGAREPPSKLLGLTVVEYREILSEPWVEDYLRSLEAGLRTVVATPDPLITEVATHLIGAGGKRIRPIIAFAASLAVASPDGRTQAIVDCAIAVELVHLASLYHDDVMDEASERRGVSSVNARYGNLLAIVTGDYLLARAAEIAARLGQGVAELLAATLAKMCEGQILEVGAAGNLDRSAESYLQAISGKTASLMATSARIPGIIAGAPEPLLDAITKIGENLGLIFQLRDDILDLFASRETLMKEPGQDLVEGVFTLPVILALRDSSVRQELQRLLGTSVSAEDRLVATKLIRESGSLPEALGVLDSYAEANRRLAAEIAGEAPGSVHLEWFIRLGNALTADAKRIAIGLAAEAAG